MCKATIYKKLPMRTCTVGLFEAYFRDFAAEMFLKMTRNTQQEQICLCQFIGLHLAEKMKMTVTLLDRDVL